MIFMLVQGKENLIPANLQLKDCRKKHNEGTIELEPETTVAQLERQFQEIFGLYIQVFRKSGNMDRNNSN